MELVLVMALKLYASVVKRLKPYVRKIWCLIPVFVGVTAEKLEGWGGGGLFARGGPGGGGGRIYSKLS